MFVSDLVNKDNINPLFKGWVTADDYVLAIDGTGLEETKVSGYMVVQMGIEGLDAKLNTDTSDKQYIRSGKSTMKTGASRSFKITGDRYIGDNAQDFLLDRKYAVGEDAVVRYAYFNILNGKGEKGTASVVVNSDGSGNAGDSSGIEIELLKIGDNPESFDYSEE